MRLIDADALIKKSVVINGHRVIPYLDVIEQPTAYDVEAKVAELEKASYTESADDMNPYPPSKVVSLKKSISIVRGKE